MARARIAEIEGIGEVYGRKLEEAGITTVKILLQEGATRKGRKAIGDKTGISDALIMKWVNHADLFRVKGVGKQYAELLEAGGVDTVAELSNRVPANLHAKLVQTNQVRRLVRGVPALKMVEKWVAHSRELPRVVEY